MSSASKPTNQISEVELELGEKYLRSFILHPGHSKTFAPIDLQGAIFLHKKLGYLTELLKDAYETLHRNFLLSSNLKLLSRIHNGNFTL